ncbi:MAG: glycoside hydrolase family 130 protein [Hyphomonadaceae bacterium]|nr:glycoside hydrolase family 130 protein [Hyphomonadaceae bacterium]
MPILRTYPARLTADATRVVLRPFHLAAEPRDKNPPSHERARRIIAAILDLPESTCVGMLEAVNADFEQRHWQTRAVYLERFWRIASDVGLHKPLSDTRRQLIGAHFCHEYSYAAAALMNPSIVAHPDQTGLPRGSQRFVLSLRAVGEGHISSIVFREGIIDADDGLSLWPQPPFSLALDATEIASNGAVLATRPDSVSISGTVIFPFTAAQRNGLEDLRLVRFEQEGAATYYGTYTAYSGAGVRSELLATSDFRTFSLLPMDGDAVLAKGMALFPRLLDGDYVMIGRQDNESMFLLRSRDLTRWSGGDKMMTPRFPWEYVQMGNCGAPIELDEGWLLLTHGVGAMRKYAIGAALLDKRDPRTVLARSAHPVVAPSSASREGYVPNVVYTCGALRHGDRLLLPYGVADSSVSFCLIDIPALLSSLA